MSTIYDKTDNYGLNLYGDNDPADLRDGYNGSMHTIDTTLQKHLIRIEGVESRETHTEEVVKTLLGDNAVDAAAASKTRWDGAATLSETNKKGIATQESYWNALKVASLDAAHRLNGMVVRTFETVSDMKAYDGISEGMAFKTEGYWSRGDGGAGLYVVETAADANKVQETASGFYLTLVTDGPTVSIRQMGAKEDSDCTDIIQRALDLFTNVRIPKGVWKVSQISLHRYNNLYGDGIKNSVIHASDDSYGLVIPKSADHSSVRNLRVESGIQIGVTGTASVQDLNCIVENVEVSGGNGIRLSHRGNRLISCNVGDSTANGILIDGTDNNVSNCVVSTVAQTGIKIMGPNNQVSNCKVFLADGLGLGYAGMYVHGAFSLVSNVVLQQNRGPNLYVDNYGHNITGIFSDNAFCYNQDFERSLVSQYNAEISFSPCEIVLDYLRYCRLDVTAIVRDLTGQTQRTKYFMHLNNTYTLTKGLTSISYMKESYYKDFNDSNENDLDAFFTGDVTLTLNGKNHTHQQA